MSNRRCNIDEKPLMQGTDEEIAYQFDFTNWGTPSNPVVALINVTTGAVVTGAQLTGMPSVEGNVVTSPQLHSLVQGQRYHLVCIATIDGNVMSMYLEIEGE